MVARRSNLSNLVNDAFEHGDVQASSGRWRGERMGDFVAVTHHNTHMFNVTRGGEVDPIDSGHGSTSDRCGVSRITGGAGCGISYRLLYDEDQIGPEAVSAAVHQQRLNRRRDPRAPGNPGNWTIQRVTVSADQFGGYRPDMNRGGPDYSQPDPFGPAPAEGTAAELTEYLSGVEARQDARRAARE